MADNTADPSDQNAGNDIKAVSPAFNAIPIVGPVISAFGSFIGGQFQNQAAEQQKAQANNLAAQAKALQPEGLQPEYKQMLRIHQAMELAGYPGYDQDKQSLEDAYASNVRAIKESSPNGAATLNALSKQMYHNNQSLTALAGANAKYQAGAQDQVASDYGSIGGYKRNLEIARDAQRELMNKQVSQLQNAAMANKFNGYGSIANSIGNTANNLLGKSLVSGNNTNPAATTNNAGAGVSTKPSDNTQLDYQPTIQGMWGASNPLTTTTTSDATPAATPGGDDSFSMWNMSSLGTGGEY